MKTKVVATIGPSSEGKEVLEKLVETGMNIARMNFSHCSEDEYKKRREIILEAGKKFGKDVAVLQDLQGPRLRVGVMPKEGRELKNGEVITFTSIEGNDGIFVDEPSIFESIEPGHPVYLVNGEMELKVLEKAEKEFTAEVIRGGTLFSRKAINVPETHLKLSGLTEKDKKDVEFALSVGVEYIAVSFVQTAQDMLDLRAIVGDKAKLIAKIETAQALKNIDEIIQASDSIMVARGDLGIEIPAEKLPFMQKNMIRQARWHRKGSIVATQMMLSMVDSKKPTRAEVFDVANAILDGADAVMLSDESANGKYPVESVEMMAKIAAETENMFLDTPSYL
jgi:pyruvate kinase